MPYPEKNADAPVEIARKGIETEMDPKLDALKRLNALQGRPLRLLLVQPEFPPSFWKMNYTAKWLGKSGTMPPLGILTIAGMCPSDWEIRVIDENVEKVTGEEMRWADLVGISSMNVQLNGAVRIARRARSLGIPAMVGGPHPTSEPEAYSEQFDILVLNEGEITFRQFIEDYRKGQIKGRYETDRWADLSETPAARYDLLRHPNRYIHFSLQFSRGCPFSCEFCQVAALTGRKHRTRPGKDFLRDLDGIFACGYRGVVFLAEDNFTANKHRVIELCRMIEEWNIEHKYPFTFWTELSVESAKHSDLLDALAQARFATVFLGLETPDVEGLERINKKQNLTIDIKESIQRFQQRGIRVDGGFIVGFDTDTNDIFDKQVSFIEDINVSVAMITMLSAGPSTALHSRVKQSGRLIVGSIPSDLDGNSDCYNPIGHLSMIPLNFSQSELLRGYATLVGRVYDPKFFFPRLIRQVSLLKPDHKVFASILRWTFIGFPLVTFVILFSYNWRWQYLKAAMKALFRYPTRLKEFTFLSLAAIHFLEFSRRDLIPWAEREAGKLEQAEPARESA